MTTVVEFHTLMYNTTVKKILSTIANYPYSDISYKEIAKVSGFSEATITRYIHIFKGHNLLIKTRRVGRFQMWRLNDEVLKGVNFTQ